MAKGVPADIKRTYSLDQISTIYKHVDDIVTNLDEYATKELLSGNEGDLDKVLDEMILQTERVLFPRTQKVKKVSFDYLTSVQDSFDVELKKKSFNYFVQTTLPEFEMNLHHVEWGNLIQFHQRLGIVAARDHSKSFTFSFAYPLWRLYQYQREGYGSNSIKNTLSKRGMIITNEQSLAVDFMKLIKEEIENNPILAKKLRPDRADGWAKEEIICKNGAELKVKGVNSALRGRHPGWIVGDDLLDESNLYSKEARDKMIDLFHSVIMNMVIPRGQVVVVGTPFHSADLYASLKESKKWRVFEYPAINPDGSLLWGSRYSLRELLDKRDSQGSIIFSREILVKPVTSDSTIFPYKILENAFVGMNDFTLSENIASFRRKFVKVVMGCDFAISSSVGADYSVFSVIGVDELDNYWLLNQWRAKGASYNEQIGQMRKMNSDFQPDVIMAEDNAFQKVMIQLANDAGLNVIPHTTGINKFDLKSGLPALATLFEQHRIKFPRGDAHSKNITDIICTEASGVTWTDKGKLENTTEHDDTLMSLWIAITAANYVNEGFSFGFI